MYLVPGAVFQSVLIGGGYGTGREVVEFISQAGPRGGLVAVGCFFVAMLTVVIASFEFARIFRVFDYRRFFQELLGKPWWVYEILAVVLLLLVLAVVISAAGTMVNDWLGVPLWVTTICAVLVTMFVLYIGQSAVEKLLTAWAGLFSIFIVAITVFTVLSQGLMVDAGNQAWEGGNPLKGFQYALYNIAAIPVLLYTLKEISSRREAVLSGLVASIAATVPALLMHILFVPHLPELLAEPLPFLVFLEDLELSWLIVVYAVLLIGTIVQTAIGVLEGVVQRVNGLLHDREQQPLSSRVRSLVGGLVLIISSLASGVGVIALIGAGYGTLAWAFMLVYALPLLTIGISKMRNSPVRERIP